MVKITLKDGSIMEVEQGSSILDVAKKISEGLARVATCGKVDGEVKDLRFKLEKDCELTIETFESSLDGKKAYWHTTSHIMAQAVKRLFPNVKFAIGPAIDEGFYYDFDVEKPFSDEDKEKIEAEMKKIIKENIEIEKFVLPKEEALKLMEGQIYKEELIRELPENEEQEVEVEGEDGEIAKKEEMTNEVVLIGFVCKKPIYRQTPFGREIADLLLAVNRAYNKSDYIPTIAWGRNARFCQNLEVGAQVKIIGRVQSRQYEKKHEDGTVETKTAYEVSVCSLEVINEEGNENKEETENQEAV